MKGVQTVVLDEVDVLFLDDSFDLSTLGATTPASAQFLFVTATLPVPVADQVRSQSFYLSFEEGKTGALNHGNQQVGSSAQQRPYTT